MAALAACGDDSTSPPAASDQDPTAVAQTATLTVRTESKPGPHGELFTEGAVNRVALVAEDGRRLSPDADRRGTFTFDDLKPGSYRIEAAQRPCDGNCGYLDPPTGQCGRALRIESDRAVSITFVVGQACGIALG